MDPFLGLWPMAVDKKYSFTVQSSRSYSHGCSDDRSVDRKHLRSKQILLKHQQLDNLYRGRSHNNCPSTEDVITGPGV